MDTTSAQDDKPSEIESGDRLSLSYVFEGRRGTLSTTNYRGTRILYDLYWPGTGTGSASSFSSKTVVQHWLFCAKAGLPQLWRFRDRPDSSSSSSSYHLRDVTNVHGATWKCKRFPQPKRLGWLRTKGSAPPAMKAQGYVS